VNVEVGGDGLLADDHCTGGCDEDGNRVDARALLQQSALGLVRRDLPRDGVDTELGQQLAHSS
jgi:hypothetical protein